ncbi:MAG: hypothetical protein RL328_1630, partial [Acidobacteriota bacterium]
GVVRQQGVDECGVGSGDDAGAGGGIGDEGDAGEALAFADAFIVGKEEGFVGLDGAADGGAELVLFEGGDFRAIEGSAGIEGGVAEVFEESAVDAVGAGLGDGVDGGAVAAELGAIGVGLGGEFSEGFDAQGGA